MTVKELKLIIFDLHYDKIKHYIPEGIRELIQLDKIADNYIKMKKLEREIKKIESKRINKYTSKFM